MSDASPPPSAPTVSGRPAAILNFFHYMREIAHDSVAIVSLAGLSVGTIVSILGAFGIATNMQTVAHDVMLVSGPMALASKFIDSANDAYTTRRSLFDAISQGLVSISPPQGQPKK